MTDLLVRGLESVQPETECEVLSWEACPRCGGLAAVGREPTVTGIALDFDCTAGCDVSPAVLRDAFTRARS